MTTKKLTFKTKEGSWRFFLLFVTLILLFSLFAQLIVQQGYKLNVSHVIYEVRGAELSMELYKPMEVDSNDSPTTSHLGKRRFRKPASSKYGGLGAR